MDARRSPRRFFSGVRRRCSAATGERPRDYNSLHFETCYHQGIEFCIEHGIARFEPGTQGEHKVSRGFEPTLTWSAHYIANRQFRDAIEDYLEREGQAVDAYAEEIQGHVPYREGSTPAGEDCS